MSGLGGLFRWSFLWFVLLSSAYAEEPKVISPLDPLVITARGYEQALSQTPGGVGIIPRTTFVERSSASITNALEEIPGVYKTSDSAWGSDINIRGRSRDSVVLLIDGARVNTATDINAQYGLIDSNDVDRVEILKGPLSSLYGSGSIGGVVNVITKRGRFTKKPELHGEAIARLGDNPEGGNAYLALNYNSEDFYSYVSQTVRNFSSYEDGSGDEVPNSQFDDRQSKVRAGFKFNERHYTELQFQYFEGHEIGIPGTGTAPLPAAADVTYPDVRRGLVQAVHTIEPDRGWLQKSEFNVYYQWIDRRARLDNFPEASPLLIVKPQADHDTLGLRQQNALMLGDHSIVAGVDIWERKLDSTRSRDFKNGNVLVDTPLPESSFFSTGIFAEDSWEVLKPLTLSFGGRLDFISVENDPTEQFAATEEDEVSWNAHIGATVELTKNVHWTLIGARGFRAASLEERYQYLQLGGGVVKLGDPDLDPEESLFFESGLHYVGDRFSCGVSAFLNSLDNLISEQERDEATIVAVNVDEAKIYGVEAEARFLVAGDLQMYAVAALTIGEDANTDEDLPDIPPFQSTLGVRYGAERGFWSLAEGVITARQGNVPEGDETTPSWQTLRLEAGYNFEIGKTGHNLFASVDNVFDEDYRDHLSMPRGVELTEPGRAWWLHYTLRF
jgi:hemoglobin/transferrin/lactoferrin receptor protein